MVDLYLSEVAAFIARRSDEKGISGQRIMEQVRPVLQILLARTRGRCRLYKCHMVANLLLMSIALLLNPSAPFWYCLSLKGGLQNVVCNSGCS